MAEASFAAAPRRRRWALLAGFAALTACASAPPAARAPVRVATAPVDAATVLQPAPPPPVVAPPEAPPPAVVAPAEAAPQAAVAASAPVESSAVAARFPDPGTRFPTPAFEPGHAGFTTNAELASLLHRIVGGTSRGVQLVPAGSSQTGVPLEALWFSRDPLAAPGVSTRPTVLLIGQQHGDEPAGAEALLVVAQQLANGPLAPLLDRIDVVVLPRANPDGAAAGRRLSASGIDINRDHLLLRTPEAQAQAQLVRDFKPVVVVDSHEFLAVGRYLQKFGAVQRFDVLLQYAMVANLPEFVTRASEEWFRGPLVKRLKRAGLSSEWYYTTAGDVSDKRLSMGGVQPDNGRNVNGLRHAVSLLVETRGSDLGSAHLARRVATHVAAITTILESTAARGADLMKLRQFVDADLTAKACQGDVVVEAGPTPSEYSLVMLDPATGADKPLTVAWDSALELVPSKVRSRPCGYWLGADQTDAVLRLRGLGVQIARLDEAGALRGETYHETARELGPRQEAGGSVADAGGVLTVQVALVPALVDAAAGSYYVSLEQPFANLVVAALEPDTQSSYVASRILTGVASTARVMVRPELKMTPVP